MTYPGAFARTTPDKPAVIMAGSGETLTYAQLEDRSARLADHLRRLGLAEGDVVALLTDNRPQASEVYWAAQRAGLYVTAVNWHLTAAEAAYIVGDCGAKALVVSANDPKAIGDALNEARDIVERAASCGRRDDFDIPDRLPLRMRACRECGQRRERKADDYLKSPVYKND